MTREEINKATRELMAESISIAKASYDAATKDVDKRSKA